MKMKILKKESFVSYLEEQTRTFQTLGEESLGQLLIRYVHKLIISLSPDVEKTLWKVLVLFLMSVHVLILGQK